MKVTIDGNPRDWTFKDDSTLQDVLLDINQRLLIHEQKVISEIKVDETVPELDMDLTPDKVTVDKVLSVSFVTTPVIDASLGDIVGHIIADEIDIAMNGLKDCIDVLIWFFDTLQQGTIFRIIDINELKLGEGSLHDYIEKLNGMLNELVTAMKNNDFTLINDYLEYELEPALDVIRNAIPQIIDHLKGV